MISFVMQYEEHGGSVPADFKHARRQKAQLVDPAKTDKLPPHDFPAECAVLGCILLSPNDCLGLCIEKLPGSEVFYSLPNRTIYEAMLAMFADGVAIDTLTLRSELADLCQLGSVGGLSFVSGLPDAVPAASNIEYYLTILLEKFTLRKAITACIEFAGRAYEHQGEVDELIEGLEHDVRTITEGSQSTGTLRKANQLVPGSIDRMERAQANQGMLSGIATGFVDFDKLTGGLQDGELVIIAARPSVGKSSWCMNVADHVAVDLHLPVVVFSLEMTAESLIDRAMCSRARVNLSNVRDGFLSERDMTRLVVASARLNQAPLWIDDASGTSITQLRAKARRLHQQHGIRLMVVDYLQLLGSTRKHAENRQQEVADVTKGIKSLAKELRIPIIAASQLNRDVEKDKKRKPRLSDIRESGEVENASDVVGFLYKPYVKLEDDEGGEPENTEADAVHLLIAKNRNGRTGDIRFLFLKSLTRFESAAKVDDEPQPPQTTTTPYVD